MPKPWIVANWKMHKGIAESVGFGRDLLGRGWGEREDLEVGIASPFTALYPMAELLRGSRVLLGCQDVFWEEAGAYTGEVSPSMARDAGARFSLTGHSERRRLFGETDTWVRRKTRASLAAGLRVVCCVGETLEERRWGREGEVVEAQLRAALADLGEGAAAALAVAYEPVWAIGTGAHASPAEVDAMHRLVRSWLKHHWGGKGEEIPILYGGSVNRENAPSLLGLPEVNGLLVGGSSLRVQSFVAILEAGVQVKRVT